MINPLEAMIGITLLIVALAILGINYQEQKEISGNKSSPQPDSQAVPPTPNPASGRLLAIETITPADVLARVQLLREELELIRFEMGRPRHQGPDIAVTNVAAREVIFQAFTLFRKVNQLRFELTGTLGPEFQINLQQDIRPFHVWRIVDAAYQCLLIGKRRLGITKTIEETLQSDSVTPNEVFLSIVQASRQVDGLFRQQLSAKDTFRQIIVATHHMACLLARVPGTVPMLTLPAFEHGKRPVDVYNLLIECYERLHAISECSGLQTMELEVAKSVVAEINPGDVFGLSIILVSELAFLHAQMKDTAAPVQSDDPGIKVPAHVYQQAGLFLHQLLELETYVKANPNWLAREGDEAGIRGR